jgi:hypothetical protein
MSEWDHLDQQDDAKPVSFTATAAAKRPSRRSAKLKLKVFAG